MSPSQKNPKPPFPTYTIKTSGNLYRIVFLKGFNNSNEAREIINTDNSGFTEILLEKGDFNLIDSLSSAANEIMKLDSINGIHRAEGAQGKRPLQYIMDKLQSNWIDSIARVRYNISSRRDWNMRSIRSENKY